MEFLGDLECVTGRLWDGRTIEIKARPGTQELVLLSPETLVIARVHGLRLSFVRRFDLTEELKERGLFLKCCWVNTEALAVLTSLGKLLLFDVGKDTLAPSFIVSSKHGEYTAISAYRGRFLMVGDINGNLIVLSLGGLMLQRKMVSEYAVKQIEVARTKLAVLMSDGKVFWTKISSAIVSKHEIGEFKAIDSSSWTRIAADPENDLVALCNAHDDVCIMDCEDYRKEMRCTSVTSLCFSPHSNLFMTCKHEIGVWSFAQDSLAWYSCRDCAYGHSIAIASQSLLVLVERGILLYPVLKLGCAPAPILFNNSQFIEWRVLQDRIVSTVQDCPGDDSITCVAADGHDQFVAVASNADVKLFSRRLREFIPVKYRVPGIEMMCWHKQLLIVATHEQDSDKHFVQCLEVCANGLRRVSKILLTERPLCLASDFVHHVALAMRQSVLVINHDLSMWECAVPFVLTQVYPCARHGKLFGLTKNHEFVCTGMLREGAQWRIVLPNVASFTVCAEQSLVFCVQGRDVLMSKVNSLSFERIVSTDFPVIGIEPARWSLLLYNDKQVTPLSYLDCLIISRLDNPGNSVKLLEKSGELKLSFLTNLLLRSIEMKRAPGCMRLLRSFPLDLQQGVVVQALRRLESSDRHELQELLGNPLDLFCQISGTETKQEYDIVSFHRKAGVQNCDHNLASALLPVLLEEYGPSVAFPAAFFCLSEDHATVDSVRAYARFLEPLLVKAIATNAETVSCVGMEMEVGMYAELKQDLEEVVCDSMADALRHQHPQDALEISALMRVPMTAFLTRPKYVSLKTQFSASDLRSMFSQLVTSGQIQPYQSTLLIRDFEAAGWTNWSTALKQDTH